MYIELRQSDYVDGEKTTKKNIFIPLYSLDNEVVKNRSISEEISVEEDSWYSIRAMGIPDNLSEEILLYLNDDLIEYDAINVEKNGDGTKTISFYFFGKKESQIFLMQYDVVRLGIKVGEKIFVTEYLLCLSSNIDDYNSVKNMIQTLLEFDDEIISRWIFGKKEKNKATHAFLNGALVTDAYKSMESYHQLINDIIVTYQRNAILFRNRSIKKFCNTQDKIPYHKIQKLGQNEFSWIVKNMEVLRETNLNGVIRYGTKKYIPDYIKCDFSKKTTDVYENRVVVSFLALVIKETMMIIEHFQEMINEENEIFRKLKLFENSEKKAPILVVKEYQIKNAEMTLAKISTDIDMLRKMYTSYEKIIPCEKIEIVTLPRKTKVFQEIQHYKEIYEYILKWYKYGEMSLEKENLLFKVKTIDKIYEYFCLFKLLILFKQHGYNLIGDNDEAIFYEYNHRQGEASDELDVANTYLLTNGLLKVTLYYQPTIYSDSEETTNGIDLYRIDSNRYYTPDFLIKCEKDNNTRYAILDSKYSKRKTLNRYNTLEKLIFKYCSSIASKSDLYPAVNFMWLLQGRNDNTRVYRFDSSFLARKYRPNISYGIYSVNDINDLMEEIWDELVRVLF